MSDYVYLTLPKDATEQDVKDQVEELARMIQGTKHEIKRSANKKAAKYPATKLDPEDYVFVCPRSGNNSAKGSMDAPLKDTTCAEERFSDRKIALRVWKWVFQSDKDKERRNEDKADTHIYQLGTIIDLSKTYFVSENGRLPQEMNLDQHTCDGACNGMKPMVLHINLETGLDENPGTAMEPVRSAERLYELMQKSKTCVLLVFALSFVRFAKVCQLFGEDSETKEEDHIYRTIKFVNEYLPDRMPILAVYRHFSDNNYSAHALTSVVSSLTVKDEQ
ncbi:hypothetical protein H696_05307 [Fonticula alba]|uniref:Uncharacterized protein n=1 Tax=Fonticula alba TaxID=691883 RepID=A0A058Z3I5_FONAL|nr:hypothetical protein H696_05307 [Fonticula alba]KCV68072.1 hypothetical protein H696_05307 [Fonticula alba]|eukprot:XP_009497446.1 hypothetical protein H696_05307 [Fonticula alba]